MFVRILIFLFISLAGWPIWAAGEKTIDAKTRDVVLEAVKDRINSEAYAHGVPFYKWDEYLNKHRTAIDAAQTHYQFGRALNKALAEFGVSHAYVKTPEVVKAAKAGKRVGIGVGGIALERGVLAGFVIQGSPAALAGIRRGDIILTVAGEAVTSPSQLSGERGIPLRITWTHGGGTLEGDVIPGDYPGSSPDTLEWLEGNVAHIKIHSFRQSYYKAGKIEDFFTNAARASAMVLDLRGNLGGDIENTYHLLGQLMERDETLGYLIFKRDYERYRKRNRNEKMIELREVMKEVGRPRHPKKGKRRRTPYKGPLVVLLDSLSGSGGELVPAVLRETKRATLVGTTSRGFLLLSSSFKLPRGYRLQLPVGEVLTSSGERIEGHGVKPDVLLSHVQTADDEVIIPASLAALSE